MEVNIYLKVDLHSLFSSFTESVIQFVKKRICWYS